MQHHGVIGVGERGADDDGISLAVGSAASPRAVEVMVITGQARSHLLSSAAAERAAPPKAAAPRRQSRRQAAFRPTSRRHSRTQMAIGRPGRAGGAIMRPPKPLRSSGMMTKNRMITQKDQGKPDRRRRRVVCWRPRGLERALPLLRRRLPIAGQGVDGRRTRTIVARAKRGDLCWMICAKASVTIGSRRTDPDAPRRRSRDEQEQSLLAPPWRFATWRPTGSRNAFVIALEVRHGARQLPSTR